MNFRIIPIGLVQGGSASYTVDPATGAISYQASIKVGKWFLAKTYSYQGTYQVDPTLLNPTNLNVGKVLTVGSLNMKVVSLGQNTALVVVTITGQRASGTALLSTNGPVIQLSTLDATVTVLGMQLALGVRPA